MKLTKTKNSKNNTTTNTITKNRRGLLSLVVLSLALLGFSGPTSADSTDPVANLTSSSGSEFVRLDWDDTTAEVTDYLVDYRPSDIALTGSIDPNGSNTVLGVGTLFMSELTIGSLLHVSGETRTVTAVISDVQATVYPAFSDTANDTSPNLTPVWVAYDDGVSTGTEAVVQGLENDIEYDFRVRAVQPGLPGGKRPNQERISTGLTTTQTPFLEGYDIVVVAGQSNAVGAALTHYIGDMTPHEETWRIKQMGKYDGFENQIIDAGDPLHHSSRLVSPGFAMTFARSYRDSGQLDDNRELLIVPTAHGGTGFSSSAAHHWNVGGTLSTDLILRSNLAYSSDPDNEFIAFLWHQGEEEAVKINQGSTAIDQQWYETQWLTMMSSYDAQITGFDSTVPTLVGQMNENWSLNNTGGAVITAAHQNLENLRANTIFVSSANPYTLKTWDAVHFTETSLIEFGYRYFNEYLNVTLP